MAGENEPIHVTAEEASGGRPAYVRYVLVISLLLVVIGMAAVFIFGTASAPQGDHGGAVTNQAAPVAT